MLWSRRSQFFLVFPILFIIIIIIIIIITIIIIIIIIHTRVMSLAAGQMKSDLLISTH